MDTSSMSSRQRQILVVEDNIADANLIREYLAVSPGRPTRVSLAQTLAEGLEMLEGKQPDVVLLDLNLPDAAPEQTLEALESMPDEFPVVVLTGGWSRKLELAALNHGAEEFLDKNHLDGRTLRRRIAHAAKRHDLQRGMVDRLEYEAMHDRLTDLPNRALFREQLRSAIERSNRRQEPFMVAFIDLDDFKSVNDTYGHPTGDAFLARLGRRLDDEFRAEDAVARVGGDEFAAVFEQVDCRSATAEVAERLASIFDASAQVAGETLHVDASIGVVHSPDVDIDEVETDTAIDNLLKAADRAMYAAKNEGSTPFRIFDRNDAPVFRPLRKVDRIRHGLEDDEFVPFYQPILDLESSDPIAYEMLARWQHPDRGLVTAGEFIGLAEQSGMIEEMTDALLGEASRDFHTLSPPEPDEEPVRLWVNLTASQLDGEPFRAPWIDRLEELPDWLPVGFELTEWQLLEHPRRAERLREAGFAIAVDDFGTGYSSLKRVTEMPIDVLKIDRSFVQSAADDPEHRSIVELLVDLGDKLDLEVIAEGIETPQQLDFLTDISCDAGQGFLLGEPTGCRASDDEFSPGTPLGLQETDVDEPHQQQVG